VVDGGEVPVVGEVDEGEEKCREVVRWALEERRAALSAEVPRAVGTSQAMILDSLLSILKESRDTEVNMKRKEIGDINKSTPKKSE
jgi:hypothetical protein